MAKKKKAAATASTDLTAGQQAFALATQHRQDLEPRVPAGTIDDLGVDLETLGGSPIAPDAHVAAAASSLAAALARTVDLVTAIQDVVRGANPKAAVRKAYGVGSKELGSEVQPALDAAAKITARATEDAAEALALGILPSDVTALTEAVNELTSAEAQAQTNGHKAAPTGKQKRAAEARMAVAVTRLAGAGALAFVQNAALRAQFEALKSKRS